MHRPEPNFNVAAQVIKQAELNPSDTAIIFEGTRRTYGEFAQRVRSLAGLLRGAGVCVGDRVGFLGFNQPSFIETMFATVSLGAIFVPLNFRLTGEELAFIIGDAGVHSLIVDPDLVPVVKSVSERLPCRHFYSVHGALDGFACLESRFECCRAPERDRDLIAS
jgi:fatty-acyl-CoA synthase